jgi:hypothetical protein
MPPYRETLVPPTTAYDRVVAATEVRGTLIASSRALLADAELEARYFAPVDPSIRGDIRDVMPLSWVSMDLTVAHYRAMDHVFPSPEQQIENGRLTAERTQNTYVRTIARALQASGRLDPAELLKRVAQATERAIRGGGAVAAYRTGPKDARVELVGYPFLAVGYARYGWQGMFESTLGLAAQRMFARQDMRFERDDRVAFLLSWV